MDRGCPLREPWTTEGATVGRRRMSDRKVEGVPRGRKQKSKINTIKNCFFERIKEREWENTQNNKIRNEIQELKTENTEI